MLSSCWHVDIAAEGCGVRPLHRCAPPRCRRATHTRSSRPQPSQPQPESTLSTRLTLTLSLSCSHSSSYNRQTYRPHRRVGSLPPFSSGSLPLVRARPKMFAAASNLTNLTSLFGKSSSLSAYTLHSPSPSPASSSSHLPSSAGAGAGSGVPPGSHPKSFNVGLWKVLPATHKTTGKDVSVWVFEKRVLDGVKMDSSGRSAGAAKDWVIEQLKKEVSGSPHSTFSDQDQTSTSAPHALLVTLLHTVHPSLMI
jgi:hypothetical protein